MEPIVVRSVSGLAIQALRGGAGQIAKARATRRREQIEQHQSRIVRAAESSIVPLLNRLGGELTQGELTVVSGLFHRSEYYEIARMIAVAVATKELDRSRDDINQMATALVVLHTGISREKASRVAALITQVLTTLHISALDDLRSTSLEEYGRIIDRAAAEKNAGYLRSIAQRIPAITRRRAEELPAIAAYTARYLTALHAKVGQIVPASLDDQRRVPIEAIYVHPRFVPHDPARFGKRGGDERRPTLSWDTLLNISYRTVILGDPGAGKSTLIQKIAYELSAGRSSPEAGSQTIPLIVTLRRYETLKSNRSLSLVQYFEEVIREDFHLESPPGAIEYLLASGNCVALFDGLDELSDTHRRKDVADAIETFAHLYASTKILVTSRTVGYWEAPLNPGTFATVGLSDLNATEIADYATKWFALQPNLNSQEQGNIAHSFVRESSTVQDLRSNPLMLSLLCNVYRGARSIPRNRADLYERCATMLFERWDEQRGIRGSHVLKSDAKAALQEIAYWVFLSDGALDPLPEKKLREKLTRFWLKDHFESRSDAEQAATSLYHSWQGRAWVLTDAGTTASGERLYRFTHRTFLEYFTAIEVVRRNPSPPRLWRAIGPHLANGSWDVVSQIAIQVLHENYRGARRKIYEAISTDLNSADFDHLERINLLSFATRHLDALNPPPASCRSLVQAAVLTAVNAQPWTTNMPAYEDYAGVPGEWIAPGDPGRLVDEDEDDPAPEIGPERALEPLLELLTTPGHLGFVARDELLQAILQNVASDDDIVAAGMFVFGLSVSQLGLIAKSAGLCDDLMLSLTTLEETVLANVRSSGITERELAKWSRVTFWAPIVAVKCKLASPSVAVSAGLAEGVMCAVSPLFHRAYEGGESDSVGVELLRAYLGLDSIFGRDEAVEALSALAGRFDMFVEARSFDPDWMSTSGLEKDVVAPYFRVQAATHAVLGDEQTRRQTPASSNLDALYAAAVILAAIIEFESWNVTDESDDQAALLRLGDLQALELIYISRLMRGFEDVARDAVDRLRLTPKRAMLLTAWAERRLDLLDRRTFSRRH